MKNPKRVKRIAVASLAALGTMAAATVAYAAFRYTPDVSADGSAETFKAMTVVGTWIGPAGDNSGLLPGESATVKFSIDSPSDNTVNARITSIVADVIDGPDIEGIAAAAEATCSRWLEEAVYTPSLVLPDVQDFEIFLHNAVSLDAVADTTCQGMKFKTTWRITFAATREGANASPAHLWPST